MRELQAENDQLLRQQRIKDVGRSSSRSKLHVKKLRRKAHLWQFLRPELLVTTRAGAWELYRQGARGDGPYPVRTFGMWYTDGLGRGVEYPRREEGRVVGGIWLWSRGYECDHGGEAARRRHNHCSGHQRGEALSGEGARSYA